jgi:hypothetical protein
MKVCPECGNDSFSATLTTRTEYTYNVLDDGGFIEIDEEVVDGGDQGDIDYFDCTDCGEVCDPDSLVSVEDYEESYP